MLILAVLLPYLTNDKLRVNCLAGVLCAPMFKSDYLHKKAGIMLSEITPVTTYHGDLLEAALASNAKFTLALDNLNACCGRGAVHCKAAPPSRQNNDPDKITTIFQAAHHLNASTQPISHSASLQAHSGHVRANPNGNALRRLRLFDGWRVVTRSGRIRSGPTQP